jgi:CTP synthase
MLLHAQGLDELVVDQLRLDVPRGRPGRVAAGCRRLEHPVKARSTIGMVGKYMDLTEAYKSLNEALIHAGITPYPGRYPLPRLRRDRDPVGRVLARIDAILVPGGFGERGIEGKIAAVRYARKHGVPYLGICLGMQVAVIEFARNVAGLEGAHSTEFDPDTASGDRADHRVADATAGSNA